MDFDKIITGIRKALYGREVREYIASAIEWVKSAITDALAKMKELLKQAEAARDAAKESANKSAASATESANSAMKSKRSADASAKSATASANSASESAGYANDSANSASESAGYAKDSANAAMKALQEAADSGAFKGDKGDTGPQGPSGTIIKAYDVTLATSSWKGTSDSSATSAGWRYQCDVRVSGCTSALEPSATVDLASVSVAQKAGLGSLCRSEAGYCRFYAASVPSANIALRLLLMERVPT